MNNISYLLALHFIDGLGPVRLKLLLDYFKDPKLAWQASEKELLEINLPRNVVGKLVETRKKLDPEKYLEYIQKCEIKWLTIFDDNYPTLLKQIYDPPVVLYYQGDILPADVNAIAVVGTRKVTGYGKTVTEKFASELSQAGLTIVSGLAHGVDTMAHQAALQVEGRTLAVLGGGLNKIFPAENIRLAFQITEGSGAVISEFPPDHPSLPGNFPARNRIISGLSLATLVTEAASDSGSLITARLALEQGRDVFAVPGPVTSSLSKGPYELIREGARIVFEPKDILEELGINGRQGTAGPRGGGVQDKIQLSEDEKKVLECLENEGKHIDEVCRQLNLSAGVVSGTLLKLEILGIVSSLGNGSYIKA